MSTVWAVTYSVAGPSVSAASFVPPSTMTPIKSGRKRRRVEYPKERESMLAEFKDFLGIGKVFL